MWWTVPCFFFFTGFFMERTSANKQCREKHLLQFFFQYIYVWFNLFVSQGRPSNALTMFPEVNYLPWLTRVQPNKLHHGNYLMTDYKRVSSVFDVH